MSLVVAGLDGVKIYQYPEGANDVIPNPGSKPSTDVAAKRRTGLEPFNDITAKAGLKPEPGEVDTRAVLFDADNDGFLDLVITAYTNLNQPPTKDSFSLSR